MRIGVRLGPVWLSTSTRGRRRSRSSRQRNWHATGHATTPDGREVDFRCHHNHRSQSAALDCAKTTRKQIERGQSLHLVTRVRSTPASREAERQRALKQEAKRQAKAAQRAQAGGKEAVSYQPPPAAKDNAAAKPPGWYLDPRWYLDRTGPQVLRWWDGTQWGQQTQPLPRRGQEPELGYPQQPHGQHPRPPSGYYGRPARKLWPQRHKVLTVLGGLAALIIILGGIASATGGGKARQTGNASPVAAATLSHTATPSPAPTHHATKKKTRPHEAPVTAQATTPAPAATAPAAAPSSPAAATSTGCYPLSDEGTCYEPGEYCRDADHGTSGIAGDGEAITCEDNDGWRWEPS